MKGTGARSQAATGTEPGATAAPSRRAKILHRTRVGALLVAVLVGMFWLAHATGSPWIVWAIGSVLGLGAAYEAERMIAGRGPELGLRLPAGGLLAAAVACALVLAATVGGGVRLPGGAWSGVLHWLGLLLCSAVAVVVTGLVRGSSSSMSSAGAGLPLGAAGLAAWIAPPLPLLASAYAVMGLGGLIALVVLSKVGDIAGYYAGNALGKSHPFPRLSPGKTTEGCTASLVFAVLVAGGLSLGGVLALSLLPALVFGAAINLASQAGDLAESALKRATGCKDSGTLFGPSGGFLDLVDSLLLSVPAALLLWPLLS